MSERIQLLYSLLKIEYPEIKFEYNDHSKKKMYINDLNYELPNKLGFHDLIFVYAYVYNFLAICKHNISIIWTIEDLKIAHNSKYFIPKKYDRKFHVKLKGLEYVLEKQAFDILAKEINLLYSYSISNALVLIPDFLQNYFYFWANNKEPLEYFLKEFYIRRFMDDINTDEERIKLKEVLIKEIVQKFGK